MVSVDEWEAIEDTAYWRSQPGIRDDIAEARTDAASGNTISGEQLLTEARRRVAAVEEAERKRRAG